MTMNEAELKSERAALVRADQDLREGEQRLQRQTKLAARLGAGGGKNGAAERLVATLRASLAEWKVHRELIVQRIAYLEAGQPAGASGRPQVRSTASPRSLR
jgi:hypothetical protein